MPDEKLAALIRGLADPGSATRNNSAMEIFRRGCELVAPLVRQWLADSDLAELLITETAHAHLTKTEIAQETVAEQNEPRPTGSEIVQQTGAKENHPRLTVGVAVKPARFEQIRTANGSPRLAEVPADQDAKEFELEFGGGVRLDILTTNDPAGGGAIARYLEKFGEGIQQVEIDVRNVDRATKVLASRFRVKPIYFETRAGANRTRVNFFLVTVPGGGKVLIELVEANSRRT